MLKIDVLVVTATDCEKEAVLRRMAPLRSEKEIRKRAVGRRTYYVGRLGEHGVALTMCRMGTVGSGASKDAVAEACRIWHPRAAIMVGIAFGADPEKQQIADVLVASQIISYEEERRGKKAEYRGPIAEAGETLVDRFRNVDGWRFVRPDGSVCKRIVGAVLSGEKLVDDPVFKARLFKSFPRAIGGEMEGRGLYAAAHAAKVEWILIKAICDWGDGTKHKKDQPLAAAAAVDLVHWVLSAPDALDGLASASPSAENRTAIGRERTQRTPELHAENTGSGSIAQGRVAVAAGAGGMAAGRDIHVTHNHRADAATSSKKALNSYHEHMLSSCSDVPLRAVHVSSSDPSGRSEQVELSAIYVDLDTTSQVPVEPRAKERGETRPLRVLEAAAKHRRMVLLGDPGSGKSTFLNYIALCLSASVLKPKHGWLDRLLAWPRAAGGLLPVRVVLRDFARSIPADAKKAEPQHLSDFIEARLRAQKLDAARPLVLKALEDGKALVLLDGLDEIPTREQRGHVCDAVVAFADRYKKSDFLVTCRTLSYQDPAWQLQGFQALTLAPFDQPKIDRFVKAWYAELARRHVVAESEAPELVERLGEAVRRPDLQRLAPNPLLLTVMALVHTHKGRLPEARALLYEETVEILLWCWGELRPLRNLLTAAGLSEIDLKRVLWRLAYEAHGSSSREGGEDAPADIHAWQIQKALTGVHPRGDRNWAHELVEAMKHRAGILVERTGDVYTFPHRTFQEYLAGVHLSSQGDFVRRASALLGEGALWREVVLLSVGRLVQQSGESDRPLALVGELCPERSRDDEGLWRKVWMAGEILLEVGVHRVKDSQLGMDLLARVQGRLAELLRGGKLSPVERARAGDALGRLGDPRFRADAWGLPDEPLLGFVEVPEGPFQMGEGEQLHEVSLPAYYIARYPVTVEQFRVFVEDSGVRPKHSYWLRGVPNHPVGNVTREEAAAYARWLGEKLLRWEATPEPIARLLRKGDKIGKPWIMALPSEAEWEKASRGTDGRVYPWGDKADPERANYDDTGIVRTTAVGSFPGGISPYDCHDMSGNVWEWTRSLWSDYPYKPGRERECMDLSDMSHRVVRGGSFGNFGRYVRAAFRANVGPDDADGSVGFRVVVCPSL